MNCNISMFANLYTGRRTNSKLSLHIHLLCRASKFIILRKFYKNISKLYTNKCIQLFLRCNNNKRNACLSQSVYNTLCICFVLWYAYIKFENPHLFFDIIKNSNRTQWFRQHVSNVEYGVFHIGNSPNAINTYRYVNPICISTS